MESPVYDIYIFGLHVVILTVPDHCLQLLSAQRIHRLLCVANNKHQPLRCTLDMILYSLSSAGLLKTEADLLYPLSVINSGLKTYKQTKYKATHSKYQRIQLIVSLWTTKLISLVYTRTIRTWSTSKMPSRGHLGSIPCLKGVCDCMHMQCAPLFRWDYQCVPTLTWAHQLGRVYLQ